VKRPGDRGIGVSGDRNQNLTAETRRRGEESGRRGIAGIAVVARDRAIALRCVWRTVVATLREIFDESAYERFLLRARAVRSVESYRDFLQEREGAAARRPRCC
jgi:hypothetical protein